MLGIFDVLLVENHVIKNLIDQLKNIFHDLDFEPNIYVRHLKNTFMMSFPTNRMSNLYIICRQSIKKVAYFEFPISILESYFLIKDPNNTMNQALIFYLYLKRSLQNL